MISHTGATNHYNMHTYRNQNRFQRAEVIFIIIMWYQYAHIIITGNFFLVGTTLCPDLNSRSLHFTQLKLFVKYLQEGCYKSSQTTTDNFLALVVVLFFYDVVWALDGVNFHRSQFHNKWLIQEMVLIVYPILYFNLYHGSHTDQRHRLQFI